MHRQVVGCEPHGQMVGCEPHGLMVGSPRTPEGGQAGKRWWKVRWIAIRTGRWWVRWVRAARADDGRDGNGGNSGRGEKGKTLSEFGDFDKVYWIFIARVEGFEPPSTVLETAILPLNYTRILKKF